MKETSKRGEQPVEYFIEIVHGRFTEDGMKSDTIRFESDDIFSMRHNAILTARFFDAFVSQEINIDNPSLAFEIPELLHNIDSYSLAVNFKDEYGDVYQIYGPEIHEDLSGLAIEAKHFLRKGLVKEEELTTILQNQLEADVEGGEIPYVVMDSNTESELPDFDYDVIKVLSNDLELFLANHRMKNQEPLKIDDLDEDEDEEDFDEDDD